MLPRPRAEWKIHLSILNFFAWSAFFSGVIGSIRIPCPDDVSPIPLEAITWFGNCSSLSAMTVEAFLLFSTSTSYICKNKKLVSKAFLKMTTNIFRLSYMDNSQCTLLITSKILTTV